MYKPQGKNQQLVGSKDFFMFDQYSTTTTKMQHRERERECVFVVCVLLTGKGAGHLLVEL